MAKKKKKWYKIVGLKGEALWGTGVWSLPKNGKPGNWMPKIDNPIACKQGYHVCTKSDIPTWIRDRVLVCEVEIGGNIADHDTHKVAVQTARIIKVIGQVGNADDVEHLTATQLISALSNAGIYKRTAAARAKLKDTLITKLTAARKLVKSDQWIDARGFILGWASTQPAKVRDVIVKDELLVNALVDSL